MSALVKGKLKAARDAIGKKDWAAAQIAAEAALDFEPDNYNANVFRGLALLELGKQDESEQAYRKAIESAPTQLLAWQGLSKAYERMGQWDALSETLLKLAELFVAANDSTKCGEIVQRLVETRRYHGTPQQLMDALSLYFHDSPFYNVLSQLPPPDPTNPTATATFAAQSAIQDSLPLYEEIVGIVERQESDLIEAEVKKRRQRIDAPRPEQVRRDVDQEMLTVSRLPKLYDEIIGHPNATDEVRRGAEAKLLRLRLRILHAISLTKDPVKKQAASDIVDEMISGVVLLNIPDELAWTLYIEGKDAEYISDYDYSMIRRFIALFAQIPLARFLATYFKISGIPLKVENGHEDSPELPTINEEDFFDLIDIFEQLPESVIAHQILAELYLTQESHEEATKTAEVGLERLRRYESLSGKSKPLTRKAFNVVLGTGLVHLNPPKHHSRALRILDEVLAQDADNVPSLMGRGSIMARAEHWNDAMELFAKVVQLRPDDITIGLRAKEEHAWCQVQLQDFGAQDSLKLLATQLDHVEERHEDQARCWWRLGRCLWRQDDVDEAFKCFITSLKRLPSFAPAFTSLGVYYAEHAKPSDPKRASKCFQKAFELDPREAEAARRLAEGFAEEREWDLVDVVARRTIEGEGESVSAAAKSRYLPSNAWAWKAVGAVELHRQKYAQAIEAYQIALRADQDDVIAWARLGEAYSRAGRHAAAIRALARARELDPTDWVSSYFVGIVLHQTGQFADAIIAFEAILAARPDEVGAIMALSESHLEMGRSQEAAGFEVRAEASFIATIKTALDAIDCSPGFRAISWKFIGDALNSLAQRSSYILEEEVRASLQTILIIISASPGPRSSSLFVIGQHINNEPLRGNTALEIALGAYEYRLGLLPKDDPARASAWADLAQGLDSWARTAPDSEKRKSGMQTALQCITEALRLDPTVAAYWVILGDIQFLNQPRAAQHAFVRAIELDKTNVTTWAHLGLLYLYHGDLELANEALLRAQTLDPDSSLAWVGQALVASANKHNLDAKALMEHAVSLSATVPTADLEYAFHLLKQLDDMKDFTPASVLPAFFVLDRYCRRRSDDASAVHLLAIVYERLNCLRPALDAANKAISIVEAAYELTEDAQLERPFAIANASAGRIALSQGRNERALEAFGSAQGLLSEDMDTKDRDGRRLAALCHFGTGIARLKMGDVTGALAALEQALAIISDGDVEVKTHITVFIAQTLWSTGTDEVRESAKAQLLQCISDDPENLTAITTLAGMGIVTGDATLVDAAVSEMLALTPVQRAALDPARSVTYLLGLHELAQGQGELDGAIKIYSDALATEPNAHVIRRQLAQLVLQHGEPVDALKLALDVVAEEGLDEARQIAALRAVATSVCGQGATGKKLAQRAVMLTPWESANWDALAFTLTQPGEDADVDETEEPANDDAH